MNTRLSHLIEWGHKEKTNWQSINHALLDLQNKGHRAYLYEVLDTGSDNIAVIITNKVILSKINLQRLYYILVEENEKEEPYLKSNLMGEISKICAEIDDKIGITILNDDTEEKIQQMPIDKMEDIVSNRDKLLVVVNIIFTYLDSLE